MAKVAVYHFHNGSGGGVLSVIRNLLRYRQHQEIENHVIYTINKELTPNFLLPGLQGAASEQLFYYSPKWNFYYTCRQLAKLLPDDKAFIVAHDWLELGMVSNLGLLNPVVQLLHGDFDFYYNLAFLHKRNVDQFICVSPVIERKLSILMPEESIAYFRFPVPEVNYLKVQFKILKIAFFVRDLREDRKQMKLLPQIEIELRKRSISVEWHLAGGGMTKEQLVEAWGDAYSESVHFIGDLNRGGIDQLLRTCNVMILPSLSEGYPVAVVEAMKYGLIPLVSYWEGAVADLVINGINGFSFQTQDAVSYAECIEKFANDPSRMQQLSTLSKKTADDLFSPIQNTIKYENAYMNVVSKLKHKHSFKSYGSRLDHPLASNLIVTALRFLLKLFKMQYIKNQICVNVS
jgi:glycosyltransferase involved in cell wall biosynthesis